MSTLIREKKVEIRKPHRCFGCARLFKAGTFMMQQTWVDDGIENSYLCNTCYNITLRMEPEDEYGYSDLREEALEIERKNKDKQNGKGLDKNERN